MENKPVPILKLSNIIKYGSLIVAILYFTSLCLKVSIGGLYLKGKVMLGNEDELLQTFRVDIPFQYKSTLFIPEHHFSTLLYWHEVAKENELIMYAFLANLPHILALFLLAFVFFKAQKDETLNLLSLLFTKNRLIVLVFSSIFIQNACRIGAEYCKILFFQKYYHFKDAYWYLNNDVFKEDLSFVGPLSNIWMLLCLFLFVYNLQKNEYSSI